MSYKVATAMMRGDVTSVCADIGDWWWRLVVNIMHTRAAARPPIPSVTLTKVPRPLPIDTFSHNGVDNKPSDNEQ